jgi:hypothetical protein
MSYIKLSKQRGAAKEAFTARLLNQYDVPISFQEAYRRPVCCAETLVFDWRFPVGAHLPLCAPRPHTATLRPVIDDVIHHTNKSERICLISISIQGCVWPCSSFYVLKFALQLQHRSDAVQEPS